MPRHELMPRTEEAFQEAMLGIIEGEGQADAGGGAPGCSTTHRARI